jgi:hypothetical protein
MNLPKRDYQRDYSLKASLLRKVASQRLVEQEKINKKLLEDSKKLSRDFKLSRAANSAWRRRFLNWLRF